MKNFILFLFLFISSFCFTQNYKLFNSTTKKLFATYPEKLSTYSLSFDSVKAIGTDSVYFNFFRIDSLNFISYDCDFWIGPECYKQNIPVWIGAKIDFNNLDSYNFYPNNGNTIHFNFNPVYGDTTIFYEDTIQKFSLMYECTDTITVLNYSDSARFFKMQHTDLNGNVINSQLNGQNIIIAKNLGLIQFFQIDSFPQVLNPLYLIGNENPDLGIIKITNEMLYDHQPGDKIQYREDYFTSSGPPWWSYVCFRKHIVLERIETSDSLKYVIDELFFYEDSSFIIINTITKAYYKYDIIAQLPFEVFNGRYKQFHLADYCDMKLWTYAVVEENSLEYCEIDNVWGYFDTNGAPTVDETIRVLGLGMYDDYYIDYMGGIQYYSGHHKEIIYFKKDDVTCGEEIIVGTDQIEDMSKQLLVYPNPTDKAMNLSSDITLKQLVLVNSVGNVLLSKPLCGTKATIDVSQVPEGIYFARIVLDNDNIMIKKIVIVK